LREVVELPAPEGFDKGILGGDKEDVHRPMVSLAGASNGSRLRSGRTIWLNSRLTREKPLKHEGPLNAWPLCSSACFGVLVLL
jgi:hypothetical protein